jgi:hypothetical protein
MSDLLELSSRPTVASSAGAGKRRVFPRGPDGQALNSEPITVSIDLSEIAFT